MKAVPTAIADLLLLEPTVFEDERGHVYESFNERTWQAIAGTDHRFVQDNHAFGHRHVLRGLHYQHKQPQGKLVRAIRGAVFDVAVDLRRTSPTFGRWAGYELSADNRRQLWIPPGCAHGFLVLSVNAEVLYKMTAFYAPHDQHCIAWDDPDLAITWPLPAGTRPTLSPNDQQGLRFRHSPLFS